MQSSPVAYSAFQSVSLVCQKSFTSNPFRVYNFSVTNETSFVDFKNKISKQAKLYYTEIIYDWSYRAYLFQMDSEDMTLEDKCENMMNIVVETRKRFGKMCVEYEQKTSLMENKMLNLQLQTISNYKFKSKNVIPQIDMDDMTKDVDNFASDILERQKRIENLKKNLRNVQLVALQLKKDKVGQKLREPLSADEMLSRAKAKVVN